MSNALQNRLVGTVILVAVTVIFLPDYLDGEKQKNTETFVDFPRSTSNLSAVAPDIFPAQEIAEATRREVVIVDEQPLDALLEEASSSDAKTPTRSGSNSGGSDQVSSESDSLSHNKANTKLTASGDTATVKETRNKSSQETQGNSLAEQTVVEAASSSVQDNAGWVVQLGSFGNQKNVNDLLRKLERAGYRTFSRKVQTSAGRLTKVFVGPELDKKKLELALPHLKKTTGLTGKVTTFDVVSN